MADPTPLTAADFDPWRLATPLQLLQLMQRLGVSGRAMAYQLGVKPAAISMWLRGRRGVPAAYRPALLVWAKDAVEKEAERITKEVRIQPTEDLQRAVQGEFGALWTRWQMEVLYDAGTLLKQTHQQYHALAGWVLKDRYTPEDVESVKLGAEALVQHMKRQLSLQGEMVSPEAALLARLQAAHDAAPAAPETPEPS
jgi:DNA-binding transcriptional regulator YdaS (Cro superfamily)